MGWGGGEGGEGGDLDVCCDIRPTEVQRIFSVHEFLDFNVLTTTLGHL